MWKVSYDDETKEIKMISMTKGDTPSFKISANVMCEDGTYEEYIPEEEDEFVFAVKQNKDDDGYLFKIDIPNDTLVCTFKEEYTKDLELGRYYFEVSLNKPSIEFHDTFIAEKILKITSEIY